MRKLKSPYLFIVILPVLLWIYNRNSITVSITNINLNVKYNSNNTIQRVKACIFILTKENDLDSLSLTIKSFEKSFNSKYNYDYVLVNDREFSEHFMKTIRQLTNAKVKFGQIPIEHWSIPEYFQKEKIDIGIERVFKKTKQHFGISYHLMCRYYSGFFYRHPLVLEYDYYWRFDAGHTEFLCAFKYDPFTFMQKNGYEYGFTETNNEGPEFVEGLWAESVNFMNKNPSLIDDKSNNLNFITDSTKNDYNLCQFFNNFEIGSFKFFRSERYLKYFEHLEQAGGFFYERWGDAPVHTIAVSMFLPKNKVFLFEQTGYVHKYLQSNCPLTEKVMENCKCNGMKVPYNPGAISCMNKWYKS